MHIFVIAGHGAGDPGACGNGFQEAERVRALAGRIKALGGDSVTLGDFSRDYFADEGINTLDIPSDWQVVELHMDSFDNPNVYGAHVEIWHEFEPDEYDKALATMIADIFPGRSETIRHRDDLANAARAAGRGYGYRLVENGFISNAKDIARFNARIDDIAKAYLYAFGIESGKPESKPETPSQPAEVDILDLAKRTIAGEFGNGEERKKLLFPYYDEVQNKVNAMLGSEVRRDTSYIEELAWRVIAGDFGNGQARKDALGSNYAKVQKRVNELLS